MDAVWRLVHLVAAAYWLGGLVMLGVVAVVARRNLDTASFRRLMAQAGRTFMAGSLLAGAAIAISGVAMAAGRLHGLGDLTSTAWGRTLLAKTGLVAIVVVLAAAHSRAGSRPENPRWLVASRALTPAILVVTLAVFYLAVRLTES